MICTKCGIDKDETNYQRYFHSSQQKWRVRRECTECYYKQRLKRKNPDLYYKNNPNYKKCNTCNEWLPIERYYFHNRKLNQRFGRCIPCQLHKDRIEAEQRREDNGGSKQVLRKPNTYTDKYQKENTFQFMKLMGWNFNEETGIWWKDGIKDINGVFINVVPIKKKPFVRRKNGPIVTRTTKFTTEQIEDMKRLRKKGNTLQSIADKYNCSAPTVHKWINYENYETG